MILRKKMKQSSAQSLYGNTSETKGKKKKETLIKSYFAGSGQVLVGCKSLLLKFWCGLNNKFVNEQKKE